MVDPEQRSGLYRAKLEALIAARDPSGDAGGDRALHAFPGGAAAVEDQAVWLLVESAGAGLGSALAWANRHDPASVQVVVDGAAARGAGTFARQAAAFAAPPKVWSVAGRSLVAVAADPPPAAPAAPASALELITELEAAGLEVAVEHGVVTGEVLGLEVARVVVADDGQAHIEAGVGRNDREAFALLNGDLPTPAALRAVADTVRAHRRRGANVHPLNRLAGERWFRRRMIDDPTRLPGWTLAPVPGLQSRIGVGDAHPAFAVGRDDDGAPVVAAFSLGIDLDLVPVAADLRLAADPHARLVLILPARDAHPVNRRLAEQLAEPAEVLPVEGDWR